MFKRTSSKRTTNAVAGSRWSAMAVLGTMVCSSVGMTTSCKDQQKCNDALQTSRQAMQEQYLDMALARQWREHAGKVCGVGPELETLDKEILEREAAIAKAAVDKAKAEAEAGQKAVESAKELWKEFDELEKDAKDQKALKKTHNEAKKLMAGLVVAYADQLKAYNDQQYDKRKAKLEAAAK